jgi:hypothetical protein
MVPNRSGLSIFSILDVLGCNITVDEMSGDWKLDFNMQSYSTLYVKGTLRRAFITIMQLSALA